MQTQLRGILRWLDFWAMQKKCEFGSIFRTTRKQLSKKTLGRQKESSMKLSNR